MIAIREESPQDRAAIGDINRLAFGGDVEARLVDRLRAAGQVIASLVVVDDGRAVGHALFSALTIETDQAVIAAVALAPVAVRPAHQRRGIGAALIRRGLALCRERRRAAVIVVGDPAYYQRFGFSAAAAAGLRAPYEGEAFMALALEPGALDGIAGRVRYPAAFDGLD